ncbi:MAG: alpha-2-macroglobulin, partial [Burkholderiales bacterium]
MRSIVKAVMAMGLALLAAATQAATVASVSPQGEVAQVRQLTVKFSEAVVAFGDLRLPDPLALSCVGATPAGSGRWANDRVWLYDFREPLPPGTRCTLKARPDWKPLNGGLTGNTDYSFNTGGPAVVSVQPYDGGQIEEDQYFLLRLNGAAVETTVLANAWCEVEGIGERIGVNVISGDPRAALLKARHIENKALIERALILACKRPLPNAAAVRLVWGKGIGGVANPKITTTIEQRFRFTVRPAFTAEFSCERENANGPCLPIRPMTLRFSAPVLRDLAAKVRLNPSSGSALAPVFDKDDKAVEVSEIKFPMPLPEKASFTIEMPSGLKDNADRTLSNASMFPLKVATGDAPPIAKFAAAPFGVIELGDPLVPVTLRHVQGDLRPAAAGGQVRVKPLKTDAEILAWYNRLKQYDESQISAKDMGLPEREWFTFESDTDAKGKAIRRKTERYFASRELSLLNKDAGAKRLDLP